MGPACEGMLAWRVGGMTLLRVNPSPTADVPEVKEVVANLQ